MLNKKKNERMVQSEDEESKFQAELKERIRRNTEERQKMGEHADVDMDKYEEEARIQRIAKYK